MEQNKTITESLRLWFMTCPLFKNSNGFLVDNLGAKATEYAILSSPTEIKYRTYMSGKVMHPIQSLNFVLASQQPYSAEILQNLDNLGFFSGLQTWVYAQSRAKNFPLIGIGKVRDISINNTPFIISVSADGAKYQVQGTITYRI